MNYEQIKATAKAMKVRAVDLIALAEGNDPFYAGLGYRERSALWFAELWDNFGWGAGVHLRRLHYRLVSSETAILKPNGKPYENTEDDWKLIGKASLAARYLQLIPGDVLIDRRNPDPVINADTETPIAGTGVEIDVWHREPGFRLDLPDVDEVPSPPSLNIVEVPSGQPYLVELWVEKSTMDDVLAPLTRRLGVNYVPGLGETSEILARQAIERAIDARRPMRILYISDFDPGGRSMPVGLARKLEFILNDSGLDLDITLEPIALTPEQCMFYRLPRTPLKETEKRAGKFEQRFGEGATELDALEALHPGELARIVEREVTRYIDPTLRSRCSSARWDMIRQLQRVSLEVQGPYLPSLEAIETRHRQILDEVRGAINQAREQMVQLEEDAAPVWDAIVSDLEETPIEIETPLARPAEPVAEPLFDSGRGYLLQLDHYRRWQGRGGRRIMTELGASRLLSLHFRLV
ncbi:hypothetical protein [Ensifer canadensis]